MVDTSLPNINAFTQLNPLSEIINCIPVGPVRGPRTVYALNATGALDHVDLVKTGALGYKCPDCLREVRARKYKSKKRDHFYHLNTEECKTAGETALHMLGKEIIANSRMLSVPMLTIREREAHGYRSEVFLDGRWRETHRYDGEYEFLKLDVDTVRLEVYRDGIRPDLIVTDVKGRELFVEIYVSHKIEDQKKSLLRSRNNATIEIDLSNVNRDATIQEISDEVLYHAPRAWIHNAAIEKRRKILIQHNIDVHGILKRNNEIARAKENRWAIPAIRNWKTSAQYPTELWTSNKYRSVGAAMLRAGGDSVVIQEFDVSLLKDDGANSPFATSRLVVQLELFNLIVIEGVRNAKNHYKSCDPEFIFVKGKGQMRKLPPKKCWCVSELVSYLKNRRFIKPKLENIWGLQLDICREHEADFTTALAEIHKMMQIFIDIGCIEKSKPKGFHRYGKPTGYVISDRFIRPLLV